MMLSTWIATLVLWLVEDAVASLENPSRSPTPPMGFNDWARFECAINQTLFTDTAAAMAAKGLLAAGYNRINLDDCWPHEHRLPNGSLTWNATRFPRGLIWLGGELHRQGFHFGIYTDAGNETCGGYPGSLGYEQQDADTFASWGIDYVKVDGCNVNPTAPGESAEEAYRQLYAHWHDVLRAPAPAPLIFSESAPAYFAGDASLTAWYEIMDWVPHYGELARHSYDIATYRSTRDPWASVMLNYNQEVRLARQQAPGYFNDPDMLIPDEPALSLEEKRSHFALWASLSAPLLISAWVPGMADAVVDYLTNGALIAVDQDALALQATLVSHDGTFDVLTKSLANGDRLVTILNNGSTTASISVPLARIGWAVPPSGAGGSGSLSVKDLWTGTSSVLQPHSPGAAINATVVSHGTAVYRVGVAGTPPGYGASRASSPWIPTGIILNADSFHCLTSRAGAALRWATCDGSDGQVWHVGRNGSFIQQFLKPSKCLVSHGSGVQLASCGGVQWNYSRTGNVVEAGSKRCLTEGEGGAVVLQTCGFLLDSQVFELPSGWQL